ncbi:MAG: transcription antitermination factor NusB, partial [Nocardioidaceae bacterium]
MSDPRRRHRPGGPGRTRSAGPGAAARRAAPPARSAADPARQAAFDVLTAVREQDAYTNLVLPPLLRSRGLGARDAAFATELVSGTLRRRGTYDAVLAITCDRPLPRVDPAVLDALRLGTHQLLSMRVPAHAAVGATVDLVRAAVGHRPAGFVNAVLRKVSVHDLDGWVRRVAPDPARDPVGYSAVAFSHPRWVVEAMAEALAGIGAQASLDALLAADNEAPRVVLAARPGLSTVEELVAAGGLAVPLAPYAVELPGGDPGQVAAVAEGRAGVQDAGSQVVAAALAAVEVEGADARWLDVCAGPGGKSALLAALAGQRDARLLAAE